VAIDRLLLRKRRKQRQHAQQWKPDGRTRRWARRVAAKPWLYEAAMGRFFRDKLNSPSFAEQLFPAVKL